MTQLNSVSRTGYAGRPIPPGGEAFFRLSRSDHRFRDSEKLFDRPGGRKLEP